MLGKATLPLTPQNGQGHTSSKFRATDPIRTYKPGCSLAALPGISEDEDVEQ